MMNIIDRFLNSITMYRLILYGLIVISAFAIIFSFLGILTLGGLDLVKSLSILLIVCFTSNFLLSKIFKAPINAESFAITSLILFLILYPADLFSDYATIALAGFIAMLSKYVLTVNKKHIFNPTAFALVIVGITGNNLASWWVGSLELLPVVAIIGFLVLRKIHRFSLFLSFAGVSITVISLFSFLNGVNPASLITNSLTSSLIIFFGCIMLTEPLTSPPAKKLQIIYGALVGVLFGLQFQIGPIISSPELALVIGNIFSYIVSPKQKLFLKLKEKNKIAKDSYEFVFDKNKEFNFSPGQYMEWTTPEYTTDSRGNRRYFTIASSPTENDMKIGIRFNNPSSSFKKYLNGMETGEKVVASQLSGEFILPKDKNQRIVFVAGGIGITPIRSMVKYLLDKKEKRDTVLFYACKSLEEVAYKDLLDQAEKSIGLKTIYLLSEGELPKDIKAIRGRLSKDIIEKEVPDYKDRIFYLSGPELMVRAYKRLLLELGIKRNKIVTDYFPGY